jgi:Autographiviridae endonuclease VII
VSVASVEAAQCRDCGENRPEAHFWASELRLKRPRCIACSKKRQAEWRARNREKTRRKHKGWRDANPEKTLEYSMSRYSITVEQYQDRLDEQNGLCACCGKPASTGPRRLLVDHDHNTGQIRGLLCRRCNTGIGMLGDDVEGVRRALSYLERVSSSADCAPIRVRRRRGRVSKLTPDLVQEIHGRFEHGESKRSIGRRIGIDPSMIRRVVMAPDRGT